MKLLSICLIFLLLGCNNPQSNTNDVTKKFGDFNIKIIDGCEYIEYNYQALDQSVYSLTHKGNCNNPIHQYNKP